ncbi:MAG TPA: phospholipid-binding domain-containing protein [Rhodospirillaceae bacterium]|nr:phospholipid-binding domain-containing protein [Rhodospirillaceae bacterium]
MKKSLSVPLCVVCLGLSAVSLSSCAGALLGAGATAGVAAASEGGISGAATDASIQIQINDLWFRHDVSMFRKLDLTVTGGRVLITGIVQNPEHRVEAVRLAWQPKGVKQVINEIRVAQSEGISGFAKDAWITTRLRTEITLNRDIFSINYTIDTVQGTVYLMGVAQNQLELNRVVETARKISGVKQVVSYVKIRGEGVPDASPSPEWDTSAMPPPPADNMQGQQWDQQPVYSQPVDSQTSTSGAGVKPVDSESLINEPY